LPWAARHHYPYLALNTSLEVTPKIWKLYAETAAIDVVNPAWLVLWAREGLMSHAAAMRSLELLGKEVIPAIKGYQPSSDSQQGA
jgi:hypothetical protein